MMRHENVSAAAFLYCATFGSENAHASRHAIGGSPSGDVDAAPLSSVAKRLGADSVPVPRFAPVSFDWSPVANAPIDAFFAPLCYAWKQALLNVRTVKDRAGVRYYDCR